MSYWWNKEGVKGVWPKLCCNSNAILVVMRVAFFLSTVDALAHEIQLIGWVAV